MRNVSVAGHEVGKQSRAGIDDVLGALDADYRAATVEIMTPSAEYTTTAGALGLSVDLDATAARVLDAGRTAFAPVRPLRWLTSFVAEHEVTPVFTIDEAALRATVADLEGETRVEPTEPTIEVGDVGLQVRAGVPGSGLDIDELRAELPEAAAGTDGTEAMVLDVETGPVAPTFTDAQAQVVADEGNALSVAALAVTVAGSTAQVSQPTLRSWMRATPVEGALTLVLDQTAITDTLVGLFPDTGQVPVDASFDVIDGSRS